MVKGECTVFPQAVRLSTRRVPVRAVMSMGAFILAIRQALPPHTYTVRTAEPDAAQVLKRGELGHTAYSPRPAGPKNQASALCIPREIAIRKKRDSVITTTSLVPARKRKRRGGVFSFSGVPFSLFPSPEAICLHYPLSLIEPSHSVKNNTAVAYATHSTRARLHRIDRS